MRIAINSGGQRCDRGVIPAKKAFQATGEAMSTVPRTREKTFFDWIRPSMVADGLIVPEPWQGDHTRRAEAQFTDAQLQKAAVVLAALHPHVVDYVTQAPVLALAAIGEARCDLTSRSARLALATRFVAAAGQSHRLPHILRAYGLAPPLRRLLGECLATRHHRLLAPLAAVPDAALSQVIPASAAAQRDWLAWLTRLADRGWRSQQVRDRFLTWAAVRLTTAEAREVGADLVDWVMLAPGAFAPGMSFEQARNASDRWHDEQVVARRQARNACAAADRARVIDYAPLSPEVVIDDLTFTALTTVDDLELESERMHHCVRTYWHDVTSGRSRIYSVRRGDRHVATMELKRSLSVAAGNGYDIAQLKGPRNARPTPALRDAAERCLEAANARCAEERRSRIAAARAGAAQPDLSQPDLSQPTPVRGPAEAVG